MEEIYPMRLRQVSSLGLERVKGSYSAAVSLCFLTILARAAFWLAACLAEMLLPGASSLAGTLTGLGLTLLLLSPLLLGVKGWHQKLDGEYHPLRSAFRCFSSWREYGAALWYCLVRDFACFLALMLPALPSLFLSAVVRLSLRQESPRAILGPFYGIFLLLVFLLALLGLFFSAYLLMGFFLADYLYVTNRERNPFRALVRSRRLMAGRRARLFRLLCLLLPLDLLCLLLAPIPFAMPLIRAALAVYAEDELERESSL